MRIYAQLDQNEAILLVGLLVSKFGNDKKLYITRSEFNALPEVNTLVVNRVSDDGLKVELVEGAPQ